MIVKDPNLVIRDPDSLEAYIDDYLRNQGLTFEEWVAGFDRSFYKARNEVIVRLLTSGQPRNVLEFACAGPFLARDILAGIPTIERYACTNFSIRMVDYCRRYLCNDARCDVDVVDADVSGSPDMRRDRIAAYDTFITTSWEHILADRELIEELPREARFIFSVAMFDDVEHVRVFESADDVYARYGDLLDILAVEMDGAGKKMVVSAIKRT